MNSAFKMMNFVSKNDAEIDTAAGFSVANMHSKTGSPGQLDLSTKATPSGSMVTPPPSMPPATPDTLATPMQPKGLSSVGQATCQPWVYFMICFYGLIGAGFFSWLITGILL